MDATFYGFHLDQPLCLKIMPDRTSLIKKINAMGRKNKEAIKLPLPKKASKPRSICTPRTTQASPPPPPLQTVTVDQEWQINWINQFDVFRKQSNAEVEKQRLLTVEQAKEIAALRATVAKQNEMLTQMSKHMYEKSERHLNQMKNLGLAAEGISTLLKRLSSEEKSTFDTVFLGQNVEPESDVDKTWIDLNLIPYVAAQPIWSQILDGSNASSIPSEFTAANTLDDITQPNIDSHTAFETDANMQNSPTSQSEINFELKPTVQATANCPKKFSARSKTKVNTNAKYKCPDCEFVAIKSDALNVHRAEFCITPPIKNRECKFCHKMFTRRALRVHMNHFVNLKHKPSGKHKNVSLAEHKAYLDAIKSEIH